MTAGEPLLEAWSGLDKDECKVQRSANAKGFLLLLSFALGYLLMARHGDVVHPLPEASCWRAGVMCALCLGMVVEFAVDMFKMPGVTKDMDIYGLMAMVGKPLFLTEWILCMQTVHAAAGAAAEVALLLGRPLPHLMTFNYSAAVFFDTIGITLTLLFLKFNYFEEKWHTQIRQMWERRGVAFGYYSLLGHIPSLPIAVLDMVARSPGYLAICKPTLALDVACAAALSVAYNAWIHVLWTASGFKCWPYPFLHDLDTCAKRVGFILAITIAISILMSVVTLLP